MNIWERVFSLLEETEEGEALMCMFEYSETMLLANGTSPEEYLEVFPSERPFADAIATALNTNHDDEVFNYTDFYSATRGAESEADHRRSFIDKCRAAGIKFSGGNS